MEKKDLRNIIRQRKKAYAEEELRRMSEEVLVRLEAHPLFKSACTVVMYWSLLDEVSTHRFVERWARQKRVLLPCIKGDDLELREFVDVVSMVAGDEFSIPEPMGELFTDYSAIDLVVVPGVAFDEQGHRLGRGRGFYDRLLGRLTCPKVGLCFPFQREDSVPIESHDILMDDVVS